MLIRKVKTFSSLSCLKIVLYSVRCSYDTDYISLNKVQWCSCPLNENLPRENVQYELVQCTGRRHCLYKIIGKY